MKTYEPTALEIIYPRNSHTAELRRMIVAEVRDQVVEQVRAEYGLKEGCSTQRESELAGQVARLTRDLQAAELMRRKVEEAYRNLQLLNAAVANSDNDQTPTDHIPRKVAGHAATHKLEATTGTPDSVDVSERIMRVLADYDMRGSLVKSIDIGPSSTRYLIHLPEGVPVSKFTARADDLAMHLGQCRVLGAVPGTGCVGLEVPNTARRWVGLGDVLATDGLSIGLGLDSQGEPLVADLARMPHLLIAGQTGSGKSGAVNTILCSLLYREPTDVQLALVDMKRVELAPYKRAPHLWKPVAHDAGTAIDLLDDLCREMDDRYLSMEDRGIRQFDGPAIVCVIDEMAELVMADRNAEDRIVRIAQLGRAARIHLVLATQRPTVDVVTGLIKANVPARLAFSTKSVTDSRVILDESGAEALTGSGDGLLSVTGAGLQRFQCAWVDDEAVDAIVSSCVRETN